MIEGGDLMLPSQPAKPPAFLGHPLLLPTRQQRVPDLSVGAGLALWG